MGLIENYHLFTESIVTATGLTRDALHVHAGLAIYLLAQLAIRTRRGSTKALQIVLGAEILNEVAERLYYGSWRWPDTLSDIAFTMMWPVAITWVSLYRRRRWEIKVEAQRQLARMIAGTDRGS